MVLFHGTQVIETQELFQKIYETSHTFLGGGPINCFCPNIMGTTVIDGNKA